MLKLARSNPYFFLIHSFLLLFGLFVQFEVGKTDFFLWVNAHHSPELDYFFRFFTHIGDGIFYIGICVLLLFISYRMAIHAFVAFSVTSLISLFMKQALFPGVPRPKVYFENLEIPIRFIDGVTVHGFNSFPSGHTITAYSVFLMLSIFLADKKCGILLGILAALAGYSRVYTAQHFLEDTLVGSLIGVVFTLVTYILLERFWERKPEEWLNSSLLKRRT